MQNTTYKRKPKLEQESTHTQQAQAQARAQQAQAQQTQITYTGIPILHLCECMDRCAAQTTVHKKADSAVSKDSTRSHSTQFFLVPGVFFKSPFKYELICFL